MNISQCANYVMNIGKDMNGEPKSDRSSSHWNSGTSKGRETYDVGVFVVGDSQEIRLR